MSGGQTIRTSETPLSALSIQSSLRGLPIPKLYGRNRVAVNMIDYDDFKAIPHTTSQSSGGKGGDVTTENTTYTYQASFLLGLVSGPITSVNGFWKDKTFTANANVFNKFLGTSSQSVWATWNSRHPTKALAYRGLAYVAAADYNLGSNASLGNHSFDVTGAYPFNAGTIDGADPKNIVTDYLTNAYDGAGFPLANLGDWTQYSDWCVANGVFLSPLFDTQQEARQAISDMMQLTNSGIYFSEGLLKISPFSDTAVTGNGRTFTPNVTPAYDLGDDDFLTGDGGDEQDPEPPVRMSRTPNADAYNQVQIEFLDSANQYNAAIASAQDQASIEVYGLKPLQKIVAHWITDAATARLVAQLILQRVLYTRNLYEFRLGWKYCRLEPCDYVTLTDTRLGLVQWPVRILSVEEDETGELSIQAEDAPPGVMHSPLYNQQPGAGYTVNYGVAPGSVVAPAFFEAPPLQAISGLAIGIAVAGNSVEWGGCEIWASNTGSSYEYVGQVIGGARYGTLSSAISAAVDAVARVALAGNGGQLLSGTAADADALSTLAIIEDEYVAYTTSALVSANVYDVTLHLRGAYSTTQATHASGKTFIRVDDAIAYSDALPLSFVGKTISFKFLSFNRWGGGKELLADVPAYTYTVRGVMAQLPPPDLSALTVTPTGAGNIVQWHDPGGNEGGRTEVARSDDSDINHATVIASMTGQVGIYSDPVGVGGVTKYYWVRRVNKQGYPTAWLGPQSGTTGTISVTLADGSVTTVKLATGAVTATKIGDGEITAPKMAANSVTAAAIAANAIVAGKIAADAVTAAAIAAGAITAAKMSANSITAANGAIEDAAITTAKIVDAAVGTLKIGPNAVSVPVFVQLPGPFSYTFFQVNGTAYTIVMTTLATYVIDAVAVGQPIRIGLSANILTHTSDDLGPWDYFTLRVNGVELSSTLRKRSKTITVAVGSNSNGNTVYGQQVTATDVTWLTAYTPPATGTYVFDLFYTYPNSPFGANRNMTVTAKNLQADFNLVKR